MSLETSKLSLFISKQLSPRGFPLNVLSTHYFMQRAHWRESGASEATHKRGIVSFVVTVSQSSPLNTLAFVFFGRKYTVLNKVSSLYMDSLRSFRQSSLALLAFSIPDSLAPGVPYYTCSLFGTTFCHW